MSDVNNDREKIHRVFFALWPDDKTRQEIKTHIQPLFSHHPGRKVPQHNWHITLAFLGNVDETCFTCIQEQAAKVSGQSFELTLDAIGFWSKPRVVWLGCSNTPDELLHLFDTLNAKLRTCGYTPEYKTFNAHMTLLRKVTKRPRRFEFPVTKWKVENFVLVESDLTNDGAIYRVAQQYSLD